MPSQAHERRMALLHRACRERGLGIHCEGGMALKNRDLQKLIRDGYLVIERRPKGIPKISRQFQRDAKMRRFGMHGSAYVRRTVAVPTPAGLALAGKGWTF